ncbi:hypothetical protein GCM10009603_01380 [Nocardiopsis exhalans]
MGGEVDHDRAAGFVVGFAAGFVPGIGLPWAFPPALAPACAQRLAVSRPVAPACEPQPRPATPEPGFGPFSEDDLATRSKFGADFASGSKIIGDEGVSEAADSPQAQVTDAPAFPEPTPQR